MIGNYGVRKEGFESDSVQVSGYCIRTLSSGETHRNMSITLDAFLKKFGVPGIYGIDTRFLTKKIRTAGVMNANLTVAGSRIDAQKCFEKAKKYASISDFNFFEQVSTKTIKSFNVNGDKTVGIIDCGVKHSIIRSLLKRKANVILFPYNTTPQEIVDAKVDGVLIGNGPGDPKTATEAIHAVRELQNEIPIAGICLGNQLISLALGAETYKLKFGHRGVNQPVQDVKTKKVYITSQNHGFAVDPKTLDGTGLEVSHINLNDGSVEGVSHKRLPIIGFQAHPEANPGPTDCNFWFDNILKIIKNEKDRR